MQAPGLHRKIHGGPAATSNDADINAPELKRRIFFEHTRMTAERDYLKNPTDTDVSIFFFMDFCFCPIVYESRVHFSDNSNKPFTTITRGYILLLFLLIVASSVPK